MESLKRKKEIVEKQLKEAKVGKETSDDRSAVIQELRECTKEREGELSVTFVIGL